MKKESNSGISFFQRYLTVRLGNIRRNHYLRVSVKFFIKEGFEMPFLFIQIFSLVYIYKPKKIKKSLRLNITSVIFKKI